MTGAKMALSTSKMMMAKASRDSLFLASRYMLSLKLFHLGLKLSIKLFIATPPYSRTRGSNAMMMSASRFSRM